MTDALSIGANVVGVIAPALQGTQRVLADLQRFRDAPNAVKRLGQDIRSVEESLRLLQNHGGDLDLIGTEIAQHSRATIISCTQACDHFRTTLSQWTRNTSDGRLAMRDQANISFFKQRDIKTMSEQLSNCKSSIDRMVNVATLYSSVRQHQMTREIREQITTIQAQCRSVVSVTERQLRETVIMREDLEDEDATEEQKARALGQLEEEIKALKVSQQLLHELLLKSQEETLARFAAGNQNLPPVTFGENNGGWQSMPINGGTFSGFIFGGKKDEDA